MNELFRRLLGLPPQASTFAREIDLLHYSVITVTMLGATAVAAAAAYFIVRYRRRGPLAPAHAQDPSSNREPAGLPLRLELGVVVGLLTLFVAWWVVGFRQFVMLQVPPEDSLVIYASGKQWMWTFIYPSGGTSNGVLYVPAGKPIKMVLSSRDVIHSFYVPEFRIKKDVLPGQVTTVWFQARVPGTASLYCAEYCGTEHSLMLAEVRVLSPAAYAERLEHLQPLRIPGPNDVAVAGQRADSLVSLAQMGERVAAEHGCLRCHTLDGTPHLGPTWLGLLGSTVPLRDGRTVQADEAYITESMMDPRVKLRAGFEPIMPSYQGQLDAPETGAIIELIRGLRAPPPGNTSPLAPSDAPALRLPSAPTPAELRPPTPAPSTRARP
jgi:cytochrome c oxidase subunit 2